MLKNASCNQHERRRGERDIEIAQSLFHVIRRSNFDETRKRWALYSVNETGGCLVAAGVLMEIGIALEPAHATVRLNLPAHGSVSVEIAHDGVSELLACDFRHFPWHDHDELNGMLEADVSGSVDDNKFVSVEFGRLEVAQKLIGVIAVLVSYEFHKPDTRSTALSISSPVSSQ